MALSAGSLTQYQSGDSNYGQISAALSSTRVVTMYRDNTTNDDIYVMAMDVSGTTLTVVSGPTSFDTTGTGGFFAGGVAPLTSDTALITYERSNDQKGYAVHADVSSGTVSFGTPVDVASGNAVDSFHCDSLTATKVAAVFLDATDGSKLKAVIMDLSGTTITPGSVTTINSNACTFVTGIAALSSTHAIVISQESADKYPFVYVFSVSGTTITAGSKVTLESIAAWGGSWSDATPAICRLSDTSAAACWISGTDPYLVHTCAITVSGTTPTAGTPVAVTSGSSPSDDSIASIAALSSTSAAITWRRSGGTGARIKTIGISGTTVTDNLDDLTLNSTANQNVSIAAFSASKIYVCFTSTTTPSGEALVVTAPGPYDWTFNPAGIPGAIKVA